MNIKSKLRNIAQSNSSEAKALRGSLWTIVGHGISQLIRLISNLILTRLLFPEVFGLMAIAQIFVLGLIMLSDVGIISSVIRSDNVSNKKFLNTAWTMQLLRNVILFVIACAISYPVSVFYDKAELIYLIPLASISLLISGFYPIKVILASRSLNLFRVTTIQIIGQFSGAVVSILFAIQYKSAIVFVFGIISSEVIQLLLYRRCLYGDNNYLCWDKQSLNELITFGKWIFFSSALGFLAQNAHIFILGKVLSEDVFGVYSVSLALALLPNTIANILNNKVVFPLFNELEREGRDISTLQKGRYFFVSVIFFITLTLVWISPIFFETLYDSRYYLAGFMSSLVLIASLPDILLGVSFNKILVEGNSRLYAALKLFHLMLILVLSYILAVEYGIVGLCAASLFSGFIVYILTLRVGSIFSLIDFVKEFVLISLFVATSVIYIKFNFEGLVDIWNFRK